MFGDSSGSDSQDEEDEEGSEPEEDPDIGIALLAGLSSAKAGKKHSKEHASGVWIDKSPTGLKLTTQRCKAMDHNNGREWEVEVWNPIEHPGGGNCVVNSQSVPRYYEAYSRALIAVSCS